MQLDPNAEVSMEVQEVKTSRKRFIIPLWSLILVASLLGLHFGVDQRIVGAGLLLAAMAAHAFDVVVSIVAMIPFVGPLIVKVLSIPVVWILNACGYLVSVTAIRRGYSKDVLTYRGLTVALITGIVIGYIFGHLF